MRWTWSEFQEARKRHAEALVAAIGEKTDKEWMAMSNAQTRTIRGVPYEVAHCAEVAEGSYRVEIQDKSGNRWPFNRWQLILDHPLTVGQTYEVEVTVREVE